MNKTKKAHWHSAKKQHQWAFLLIIIFNYKNQFGENGKEQTMGSSRHTTVPRLPCIPYKNQEQALELIKIINPKIIIKINADTLMIAFVLYKRLRSSFSSAYS